MGLANLVPGISGGTMLLAAGVYPAFISAIAELSTLRFRLRSLVLLGSVVGAAACAILLLAGPTRSLVVEQRWMMYSLFIGLTLGGVPLVWRMARPATPALWASAAVGLAVMLLMAFGPEPASEGNGALLLRLLAGMAGAGAMILPGVSGGYLLLLLGQYLPILAAIDQLKQALLGLRGAGLDMALLSGALAVVVPVGIGVVCGVVGISNLLRYSMRRFPKATLGLLLGLLVGAVAGLWPFQRSLPPQAGEPDPGRIASGEMLQEVQREGGRLVPYAPAPRQGLGAFALVLVGIGVTRAIDSLGAGAGAAAEQDVFPSARG